jgi:hypothetical protein
MEHATALVYGLQISLAVACNQVYTGNIFPHLLLIQNNNYDNPCNYCILFNGYIWPKYSIVTVYHFTQTRLPSILQTKDLFVSV